MLNSTRAETPLPSANTETKIGRLPSSWKVVSLEDVTDSSAPIRYGVVQIGPDTPDGVPIIPIKHIRRINDATLHRASPDIEGAYAGSRVKGGDVLISVKGTIGDVGVVPTGFEGNIAREIARIRPNSDCDADFLSFQLQADQTQRRIDSKVVGSTRLEFSIHAVRDFLIALPPLPEQRKIAAILRTWDAAIEKLEALRAGKVKFLNWISKKVIQNVSDNVETVELSLSEITKVIKGQQLNKLNIVAGNYPVWNGGIQPSGFHEKYNTNGMTITISEGGNSCGFVNFETKPFWLGGHCYALMDLSESVDKHFLFHFLKTHEPEIMNLRVGSGLPNIQRSDIENFSVLVPHILEQKRIALILSAAKKEISLLTDEIETLNRQKRGLMQKLLTGEWPVKVEVD